MLAFLSLSRLYPRMTLSLGLFSSKGDKFSANLNQPELRMNLVANFLFYNGVRFKLQVKGFSKRDDRNCNDV